MTFYVRSQDGKYLAFGQGGDRYWLTKRKKQAASFTDHNDAKSCMDDAMGPGHGYPANGTVLRVEEEEFQKFDPDKAIDEGGPTNGSRAEWAAIAVRAYANAVDHVEGDDGLTDEYIRDLITDLGHLMDREKTESEWEIEPRDEVESALDRWEEER